jgi:predicted peroxiredoxin
LAQYVLIESRDPFEYGDSLYMYELAGNLASKGNDVTLFLVQNGVLTTRKGVKNNPLATLRENAPSVKVSVDDFSLRERGISEASIVEGASVSNVDDLVDLLVQEGAKIVWH